MSKIKIKFKHQRFNTIQAVYGGLDEDASLLAVEQTEKRLEELFEQINAASKDNKDFADSEAIEMCVDKAQTTEELIIFIHKVSAESACPAHPFMQMLQMKPPTQRGDGSGE